jgi:hypothetical protein
LLKPPLHEGLKTPDESLAGVFPWHDGAKGWKGEKTGWKGEKTVTMRPQNGFFWNF